MRLHTLIFAPLRSAALIVGLFAGGPALADRAINVDGSNADWVGVTTCFTDEGAGDASGGVDLSRACLENDNASGDVGKLYALFETANPPPTDTTVYFGVAVDVDNDGDLDSNDEAYALRYDAGSTTPVLSVHVYGGAYMVKRQYASPSDCGGSATSNGWSFGRAGNVVEMGISYGCVRGESKNTIGPSLSYGNDERLMLLGVYPAFDFTEPNFYDGTTGTMYPQATTAPPPILPALTSMSGKNKLFWTNPLAHAGTLIVRRAGSFSVDGTTFTPTNGTRYTAGTQVKAGSGKNAITFDVVFADGKGDAESYTDTGLTDGTRYYYKIWNHTPDYVYSSGEPSPNGIFGEPRAVAANEPVWCYSTMATTLQQPLTQAGVGVYTSGNSGRIIALRTAPGQTNDGDELWRPVSVGGTVQSRFPLVPLKGRSSKYIVTGTSEGLVAVVDAATGATVLSVPTSVSGIDFIPSFLSVQLHDFSDAAFKAAHPGRDLIFVAGRKAGTTTYKVAALSSADGSLVWAYEGLSSILGGMMIDYPRNRLYAGTSAATDSVKVFSTTSGALLGSLPTAPVTTGVVKDFYWNNSVGQVIVTANNGLTYGFDLGWTTAPGAPSWTVGHGGLPASFPIPIANGFLVSLRGATTDSVRRYSVTTGSSTAIWSPGPNIPNPSGAWFQNTTNTVWASGSDNSAVHTVNALDFATGATKTSLGMQSRPGMPGLDMTAKRLVVGLEDGRVCAYATP